MTLTLASTTLERRGTTRLHSLVGIVLMLIVAIAPAPLGSVAALYWAASAAAVGLITMLYAAALALTHQRLRGLTPLMKVQGGLFALLLVYLALQALPLGQWLGSFHIPGLWGTLTSDWLSVAPKATILMLLRQVGYGLFFYLMLQAARNPDRRMRMLDTMVAIVTVYALIALFSLQAGDVILGFPKWAYLQAATGTFVNRNSLATFLALGACIAFAMLAGTMVSGWRDGARRMEWGRLLLHLLAFAVLMLTIVATQSRMGLFSVLCGCLVALTAVLLARRDWKVFAIGLAFALVAIAGSFIVFGNGITERLLTTDNAAVARVELYQQVLHLISLRPWLGYGGGSFEVAFPLVHSLPVAADLVWDRAHNTYLALWAELGIVVGSIPLIIFALLLLTLFRSAISGRSIATWLPAGITMAAVVTAGLHSLVDFSLEIQGVTYLFLAITACGAASVFDVSKPNKA